MAYQYTYTTPTYGDAPDFTVVPPADHEGDAPSPRSPNEALHPATEEDFGKPLCIDPQLIFGDAQSPDSSTTPMPSASAPIAPPSPSTSSNWASDLHHGMDKDLAYSLCRNRTFPAARDGKVQCPVLGCKSTFESKQSVVRHIWERPVVCDRCGKSFTRGERSTIERHQKTAKCRAAAAKGCAKTSAATKKRRRKDGSDDQDGDENYDPSARASKRRRVW